MWAARAPAYEPYIMGSVSYPAEVFGMDAYTIVDPGMVGRGQVLVDTCELHLGHEVRRVRGRLCIVQEASRLDECSKR